MYVHILTLSKLLCRFHVGQVPLSFLAHVAIKFSCQSQVVFSFFLFYLSFCGVCVLHVLNFLVPFIYVRTYVYIYVYLLQCSVVSWWVPVALCKSMQHATCNGKRQLFWGNRKNNWNPSASCRTTRYYKCVYILRLMVLQMLSGVCKRLGKM